MVDRRLYAAVDQSDTHHLLLWSPHIIRDPHVADQSAGTSNRLETADIELSTWCELIAQLNACTWVFSPTVWVIGLQSDNFTKFSIWSKCRLQAEKLAEFYCQINDYICPVVSVEPIITWPCDRNYLNYLSRRYNHVHFCYISHHRLLVSSTAIAKFNFIYNIKS